MAQVEWEVPAAMVKEAGFTMRGRMPRAELAGATLSLTSTIVLGNLAIGGSGADGAGSGQGIGGGLYLASGGSATLTSTLVVLNFASTSDDNIYGS